jgi:tetratricopeptide (TPR) repeat protein
MNEWLDFSDFVDKTQELIELGLYEEAKGLLDHYSDSFVDEWEYWFIYSRLYGERNRPQEAIPLLRKGLGLDPTNIDCLVGLFYAYAMLNQLEKAGKYLFRAEKSHPDNELVVSALIWYFAENSQLEKAIAYFEKIKTRGTTNPETFRNAGIAYDRNGQMDKAIECYSVALELQPHYDEVRELLSDLYLAAGKPDKAIGLYEDALKESPNNIRYRSRLVFCLSQNNQLEKAIATAEESIKHYPNSPIGYIDLAYIHLNAGELEKALSAAEKASDISPLDGEACRVKAIIFSEKKMNAEAEKAFEAALALDPDNPEIQRDYYHHFRETGDFEKMESIVFSVIEKEKPSCMEEYWFLADYYREQQQNLKALHYINKAYKSRPAEYDLLPLIIDILIENGHTKFSLAFLRRYVKNTGWNDVMNEFESYPELGNKRIREGLRFLRYSGCHPVDFYRFVFKKYLVEFTALSLLLILLCASFPIYLIAGTRGLTIMLGGSIAMILITVLIRFFRMRQKALYRLEH